MKLSEKYQKEILPKLKESFGYRSALAAPRLSKVTINIGVGRFSKDKAHIDNAVASLRAISGQQPVLTKAKKSISAFKVREGAVVGVMATLRGKRMYDFLEKLINIALPRVRDFRGISQKSVDRQGNLAIGFKENIAFPEIRADELEKIHGLEIAITTTAQNRASGLELLKLVGVPFRPADAKEEKSKKNYFGRPAKKANPEKKLIK